MNILKTIFTFLLVGASNVVSFGVSKPSVKTFDFVGDTDPTGYFDPLQLTQNLDDAGLKYLREAELQHGRIAMASMVALPLLDIYSDKIAINSLSSLPVSDQLSWLTYFSFFEWARLISGYENFFKTGNIFKLTNDHIPGSFLNKQPSKDIQEKELNNARLAMIGSLGYIAQEFVTGEKIIGF